MAANELSPGGRISRADSVTDDFSVMQTNDDATLAKMACVRAKYYYDAFISHFCSQLAAEAMPKSIDPEIKQGYWARVRAIEMIVEQFIEKTNGTGQILSVGCGFDTLYFRLVAAKCADVRKYVEVDFSSVTAKKIGTIMRPNGKVLKETLEEKSGAPVQVLSSRCDMYAPPYHLLGADLRQEKELVTKLDAAGIDYSAPTLIIAECVFVYMSNDATLNLLKFCTQHFTQCAVVNYDQINTGDTFSEVMRENLRARGLTLVGADACHDRQAQIERFEQCGFNRVIVKTMQEIWQTTLNKEEVERIERVEFLDEVHLRVQLLQHYCIVYAAKCTDRSALASIKI